MIGLSLAKLKSFDIGASDHDFGPSAIGFGSLTTLSRSKSVPPPPCRGQSSGQLLNRAAATTIVEVVVWIGCQRPTLGRCSSHSHGGRHKHGNERICEVSERVL